MFIAKKWYNKRYKKKECQAINYKNDLTDKQWEEIKEFFPSGNKNLSSQAKIYATGFVNWKWYKYFLGKKF